jgi:hypothetical protein
MFQNAHDDANLGALYEWLGTRVGILHFRLSVAHREVGNCPGFVMETRMLLPALRHENARYSPLEIRNMDCIPN